MTKIRNVKVDSTPDRYIYSISRKVLRDNDVALLQRVIIDVTNEDTDAL